MILRGNGILLLPTKKLIINQERELDFIKRLCFPIAIDKENDFENTLINSEVFEDIESNKELIVWLEKLGVTDPGSLAYLEKEIIGNIENCVDSENYLKITKFIFELHKDNKLKDDHYTNLQELPLKTNRGFKKANQSVFSLPFNPTTDFSKVLPNEAYLVEDYLEISSPQECKSFFKQLSVIDDIEFIKSSKKLSSELPTEYVNNSNAFAKDGHDYPHLIGIFTPNLPNYEVSFYLQYFSFLEHSKEFDFSILFWERIFSKYDLALSGTGTSRRNNCPEREYKKYNLGKGLTISSLDEMNWGRYLSNTTKVPGYIFWYFQNVKCIPTYAGVQLASDTFTNSEYVKEIAGEYLPVFKGNMVVPENWSKQLKFKTKFSIQDLLYILNKISLNLKTQGFINKEDEKRIGLIYNELLSRLEVGLEDTTIVINNWFNNKHLISTTKKNTLPNKLLYINTVGFKNISNGIETILIPKNVDTKHPFFEKLLKAFGVKIIDSFSYQAENEKAFYDLQIKLLKLIGPITLLLKNKMVINDLDRSLYERFLKISITNFIRCDNIRPVFVHESNEFEGEQVMYHYDEVQNNFLISENWKSPNVILNISYVLSKLLSAIRLEKEIMMMLNMEDYLIVQYLKSIGIEIEEYTSNKIAQDILKRIQELENKLIFQPKPFVIQSIESNTEESIQNEETTNLSKKEDPFLKEVEDFIANELEGTEWSQHIVEIKELLQLNTAPSEQKKKIYNLLAKLKLAKYRNIRFDKVDESDREFNYLEGNGEKYIVHSARGSFAYIAPVELIKMRDDGYMMALDFGNKIPIKIYHQAEELLSLNTNHLLLYQNEKTMEELFNFCDSNRSANKRLLIIDRDYASNKSKELLKLMIPDEEY